jgi:hypothetical protein
VLRIKILFSITSVFFLTTVLVASNTVYVAADSPNDPGSGTQEYPFRRIQEAMNAATSGDIIILLPGVYSGTGNYDLNPQGKTLTIQSLNPEDPASAADTVIDPNFAGEAFTFNSGEDPNFIIAGITIRKAKNNDESNGGAIICITSSPTFRNTCFLNNASPTVDGRQMEGGAVYCDESANPVFDHCIFAGNSAWNGGAIVAYNSSHMTLIQCTVVGNASNFYGGGIYCDFDSQAAIQNSIFWYNTTPFSGDGGDYQITIFSSSTADISWSDIQFGEAGIQKDGDSTLDWDSNNLIANPCFASFDLNGNPDTWDFHLQSAYGRWDQNTQIWIADANTSPCLDAGDPNSEWSNEPWPNGKRVNMGAYGGSSQASKNGNPADFNVDNRVNLADFFEMSEQWLAGHACIEDLNMDKDVNFDDFAVFAENWLWERP